MIKYLLILISASSLFISTSYADGIKEKNLPIELTEEEKPLLEEYIREAQRDLTDAPKGPIHSLGEWEEAEAAMTLWNNGSLIKALSENGNVKILADSNSDKNSWISRIKDLNLDESKFSFFVVPTDSMWVRDYGPWWIVDGEGKFGIVDTIYNRPRPRDDVVPDFIGRQLNVSVYKPGLVHTGGNYYSDGLGNAFSSTLIERENNNFSVQEILERMLTFLGIESYTRSDLGKNVTIEHLDTFGKLVAPDTWVFSQFSESSRFYKDSERMVEILKNKTSPYGTPYKILRLKMVGNGERFRAYINSFISNGTLYFPAYGDQIDDEVKAVYQAALPGYKIVGVSAQGTEWGDSVHCRTRNLIQKDTIFIFPKIQNQSAREISLEAKIIPREGHQITSAEAVFMKNGQEVLRIPLNLDKKNTFKATTPLAEEHGEFYILAKDTSGKIKTHPMMAPQMLIKF